MNAINVMNATDGQRATSSVYGAVRLGYVLVESPRLAEWKLSPPRGSAWRSPRNRRPTSPSGPTRTPAA